MDSHALRQPQHGAITAPRVFGNEWALVQQAMAGDEHAMEVLLAPNMRRLYRVALAMLRNNEDAEDALQNGLYKAYRCLGSFQGRSSFATWLTRIVVNSALMILRRRRNYPESFFDEVLDNRPEWPGPVAVDARPNPEQVYALVELNALIEEQLLKLPPSEQSAFRHYAVDGHSMKESCLTLGIPATAFKSRILRTRRKLARGLECSLERD